MRLFEQRESVGLRESEYSVDHRGKKRPRFLAVPSGPLAEVTAAGLILIATALVIWAYRKAVRTADVGSYDPIFWSGMVLAYLTVLWRAISGPHAVRWLGFLGLFTVLPKFLMSPNGPIYYDETTHFALLRNIVSAGHLFQSTPLLPIGTYYPGMESAAATIHWLTGMSEWDSALTLIAAVHSLLLVQIYYIARALAVPHPWAVVAGLVYAANPSFIYEDSQFAYESMAILIMLAIIRLYVEALAAERSDDNTWTQSLSTILLLAVMSFACVVTHHLTSLTGVGLLLAGAFTIRPMSGFADRKGGWRRLLLRWIPGLTLGACFALWVAFVAPGTISYLFPHVAQPASQILAAAGIGHSKSSFTLRSLFSGSVAPVYERISAFAAPVMISLALLVAVIRWLWKRAFKFNFLWSFVLTAAYLVSLPITLLAQGAAGAHRTWASTFVGVALLPAALVFLFALDQRKRWLRRTAATVGTLAFIVLLVGNTAAGIGMDYRYPGPYRFGSDTLSVTPETITLDRWVLQHLGAGAGVVTDRFTGLSLTGTGAAVTPLQGPGLPIASIWYNKLPPTPALMSALQSKGDDYIAVDLRDTEYTPTEVPLFFHKEPARVPVQNMTRLAQWPWLKLLYSSQHYRLYEINFSEYYIWYPFHANAKDSKD